MTGYIGVVCLAIAYILLITKESSWFVPINLIASILLTAHAYLIQDRVFIIVNAFVSIILAIKFIQQLHSGQLVNKRKKLSQKQ